MYFWKLWCLVLFSYYYNFIHTALLVVQCTLRFTNVAKLLISLILLYQLLCEFCGWKKYMCYYFVLAMHDIATKDYFRYCIVSKTFRNEECIFKWNRFINAITLKAYDLKAPQFAVTFQNAITKELLLIKHLTSSF